MTRTTTIQASEGASMPDRASILDRDIEYDTISKLAEAAFPRTHAHHQPATAVPDTLLKLENALANNPDLNLSPLTARLLARDLYESMPAIATLLIPQGSTIVLIRYPDRFSVDSKDQKRIALLSQLVNGYLKASGRKDCQVVAIPDSIKFDDISDELLAKLGYYKPTPHADHAGANGATDPAGSVGFSGHTGPTGHVYHGDPTGPCAGYTGVTGPCGGPTGHPGPLGPVGQVGTIGLTGLIRDGTRQTTVFDLIRAHLLAPMSTYRAGEFTEAQLSIYIGTVVKYIVENKARLDAVIEVDEIYELVKGI